MHLIVDIRSPSPVDPMIARYASNWVDLWQTRHPGDTITYIHFSHQICPDNGKSVIVKSAWHGITKSLVAWNTHEIFRCVNFSTYSPYDPRIPTISHIYDHVITLYPKVEHTWWQNIIRKHIKSRIRKANTIIVPSLAIGQEAVDIMHIREDNIEIIPYISLQSAPADRNTLHQLSISWPYWIYDGSYGSEANIHGLLKWYKSYQELGWTHHLLLIGRPTEIELHRISDLIQKMNLTGHVRILWVLDEKSIESLYAFASGWIYIGAYYASGPRIELARSHNLPLLISSIPSLIDYQHWAISIHPNHLGWLGQSIRDLENITIPERRKVSNENIMKAYEKIISLKR